ncbi:histone-lysine N-methyltransferase SETMAR [Trichonephila clavipes]|nr:histone-lysine N-methyltransferase SETMAR [Trichonephila clavipes]
MLPDCQRKIETHKIHRGKELDCTCTSVVILSFEHRAGNSTIWLCSTLILSGNFKSGVRGLAALFFHQPLMRGLEHAVEPRTTLSGSYYADVLRIMVQHVKRKYPLLRNGFVLFHDNNRPHITRRVLGVFQQNNVEILPHPPYNPDLAPCDFGQFPPLKKPLRGKNFASNKACVKVMEAASKKLSQNGLLKSF